MDDTVDFIEEMPANIVKKCLKTLMMIRVNDNLFLAIQMTLLAVL